MIRVDERWYSVPDTYRPGVLEIPIWVDRIELMEGGQKTAVHSIPEEKRKNAPKSSELSYYQPYSGLARTAYGSCTVIMAQIRKGFSKYYKSFRSMERCGPWGS